MNKAFGVYSNCCFGSTQNDDVTVQISVIFSYDQILPEKYKIPPKIFYFPQTLHSTSFKKTCQKLEMKGFITIKL